MRAVFDAQEYQACGQVHDTGEYVYMFLTLDITSKYVPGRE